MGIFLPEADGTFDLPSQSSARSDKERIFVCGVSLKGGGVGGDGWFFVERWENTFMFQSGDFLVMRI